MAELDEIAGINVNSLQLTFASNRIGNVSSTYC